MARPDKAGSAEDPALGYGSPLVLGCSAEYNSYQFFNLDSEQYYGKIDNVDECRFSNDRAVCVDKDSQQISVYDPVGVGVIVGAVIGGVAAIVIIVLLSCYAYRKYKSRKMEEKYGK